MNNKSQYKILFFVVLLCSGVFALLFFTGDNKSDSLDDVPIVDNEDNTVDEDEDFDESDIIIDEDFRPSLDEGIYNTFVDLNDYGINSWLISTINKFISYNSASYIEKTYDMLNSEYRLNSSLLNFFNDEYVSSFSINEVVYYNNETLNTYFVKGYKIRDAESGYDRLGEYIFIIQVDDGNGTFSILPTDYTSMSDAINDDIIYSTVRIESNDSNKYSYISQSVDQIARYYVSVFNNEMVIDRENAYSWIVDGEFTSYEDFKEYIDLTDIIENTFISVDLSNSDDELIYEIECANYDYTFYVESIYDFKVIID